MSWLNRTTALICNKRICATYFFNEIRLIHPKYFTSFNNKMRQNETKTLKYQPFTKRELSFWSNMKFTMMEYRMHLADFYKNKFSYVPVIGSSKYKYHGYLWYKTLEEVDFIEFFTLFNMPDTFYSRFKACELYVWMLMVSLPRKGRISTLTRIGLIEAMWMDNLKRAKVIDIRGRRVKKDMDLLYKKFQVSLLLYDEGFFVSDMKLCSALWYNFFDKEHVDVRYIEALISYVRHQVNHLHNLNMEALTTDEEKTGIWLPVKPHLESAFKSLKALQQSQANAQ